MGKILKKPIRWEDGFVIPPEEPGLGVELNEEVALAHPWTGEDLHLMPRFAPVLAAGVSARPGAAKDWVWRSRNFTGAP